MRVIAVDDNKAVHRGQLGKLVERVDDIVDILEEVEMILLYIEDNRNGRCKRRNELQYSQLSATKQPLPPIRAYRRWQAGCCRP